MYAVAFARTFTSTFPAIPTWPSAWGRVLGFHFVENFNYPYLSRSVTEFWRRWHISLGSWFRDYVYIPMGRQPGQPLAVGSEHPHRVDAYGAVARRGVEFRAVGAAVCRAAAGGKVDSRPAKAAGRPAPWLCAAGGSPQFRPVQRGQSLPRRGRTLPDCSASAA